MSKSATVKAVGNFLLVAIVILVLALLFNDYLVQYALEHPDGT